LSAADRKYLRLAAGFEVSCHQVEMFSLLCGIYFVRPCRTPTLFPKKSPRVRMMQVNQTMDSKSSRCRELTSLYPIPLTVTRPPSDLHAKVVSSPELSGDALDLSASSGATSAMFYLWIVSRNGNPPRPACTSYEMVRMVWHHKQQGRASTPQ
jgi:hypothetical protein